MAEWFLVAGGPSLRGFDWSRLRGKHVIAINKAYKALPEAEVLYWSDWRFYDWNRQGIGQHRAIRKITALRKWDKDHAYDLKRDPIEIWRFTGLQGLDRNAGCLRHGNNAGYAAINLSVHLGAHRIYLLGYDMRGAGDGALHWHEEHPVPTPERAFQNFAHYFSALVEPLRHMGIEVWNLSPVTMLTCFPMKEADDVL